jgi:hypothetical protein
MQATSWRSALSGLSSCGVEAVLAEVDPGQVLGADQTTPAVVHKQVEVLLSWRNVSVRDNHGQECLEGVCDPSEVPAHFHDHVRSHQEDCVSQVFAVAGGE